MGLNSNNLEGHRVLKLTTQLTKWNDFRTANWLEIVEFPELVMQQAQQMLTID